MRPRPSDDPVMNTRATLTPPVMSNYRLANQNALPAPHGFPFILYTARRRRACVYGSNKFRQDARTRAQPCRRGDCAAQARWPH